MKGGLMTIPDPSWDQVLGGLLIFAMLVLFVFAARSSVRQMIKFDKEHPRRQPTEDDVKPYIDPT